MKDQPITLEEFILVCHYLYYVRAQPCLDDYAYDQVERAAKKLIPGFNEIDPFGSDIDSSYPDRVKRLADLIDP